MLRSSTICSFATRLLGLTIFISILVAVVFPSPQLSPPNTSETCVQPPLDNCSFYADCLETRYHCGPTGYPLGYGQKYCDAFQVARKTLSAEGQAWMVRTMHCLQLALVDDALGTGPNATRTCAALEDKAFGTHARCYVQSGVCRLPVEDWEAILEIVHFKTLFDSWDALKASLGAGTECLEFFVFLGKKTIDQW
ncbi:hypothetical protein HMN09_01019400 [Mycena chlorophos]|uniref:Uncharacterized protein n=1 Tax=Mycena chlorophos TaxID=658473 RepID=A0A8H6SHM2_MYCCL|nr:hypothetical protein HMN09_01019400 [Mycena chlorophos]